jgi:hypothetical protein
MGTEYLLEPEETINYLRSDRIKLLLLRVDRPWEIAGHPAGTLVLKGFPFNGLTLL